MSEIFKIAHDMAKDLAEVGAMDNITMRMMDRICVPAKPEFTAAKIRLGRGSARCHRPNGDRHDRLTLVGSCQRRQADLMSAFREEFTMQEWINADGSVAIDELRRALRLTRTDLAAVLGMPRGALSESSRLSSEAAQHKLRDFVEILTSVIPWAGSAPQAYAWFCAQPLPSFGDKTPADLMREGRADAVKCYISRISVGGYVAIDVVRNARLGFGGVRQQAIER